MLVAVLAFGGPDPTVGPGRFVSNLGGGSLACVSMTTLEMAPLAKEVAAHDAEYCVIAD